MATDPDGLTYDKEIHINIINDPSDDPWGKINDIDLIYNAVSEKCQ